MKGLKNWLVLIVLVPFAAFSQDGTIKVKKKVPSSITVTFPFKDTVLIGMDNTLEIVLEAPYKYDQVNITCTNGALMKSGEGKYTLRVSKVSPVSIKVSAGEKVLVERMFMSMRVGESMLPRLKKITQN
jgi:hypothetical protein